MTHTNYVFTQGTLGETQEKQDHFIKKLNEQHELIKNLESEISNRKDIIKILLRQLPISVEDEKLKQDISFLKRDLKSLTKQLVSTTNQNVEIIKTFFKNELPHNAIDIISTSTNINAREFGFAWKNAIFQAQKNQKTVNLETVTKNFIETQNRPNVDLSQTKDQQHKKLYNSIEPARPKDKKKRELGRIVKSFNPDNLKNFLNRIEKRYKIILKEKNKAEEQLKAEEEKLKTKLANTKERLKQTKKSLEKLPEAKRSQSRFQATATTLSTQIMALTKSLESIDENLRKIEKSETEATQNLIRQKRDEKSRSLWRRFRNFITREQRIPTITDTKIPSKSTHPQSTTKKLHPQIQQIQQQTRWSTDPLKKKPQRQPRGPKH